MIISAIKSKFRINTFISVIFILIILVLLILLASLGENLIFGSRNSSELFNENVSFGRMILDRTGIFTVKKDGKAIINVSSDIEDGEFYVALFNPEGNLVYEYEGLKGSDEEKIEIYEGDWTVKITGGDVVKGKYRVLIRKDE